MQLEWRLKKHKTAHEIEKRKKCHYYNNRKPCPYEEVGCMFKHDKSNISKFIGVCRIKLCPNQREQMNENKRQDINNHSCSDINDFECKPCGQTFENDEDLTEDEMEGTCDFGCEDCGTYFIDDHHLNVHLQRHCIKCYEEFQPKSVLEAHKKICKGIQY